MKKVLLGVIVTLVGLPALAVAALWLAGMRSGAGHTGGSIVIDRSAAEIWPYFTEPEKLKEWQSGVREITRLSAEGVAVGAKSRVVAGAGPDEHPFPMEHVFTAVEAPKRLAYTLSADQEGMGFVGRFQVRLDEKDGATTVTMLSDTEYLGAVPRIFEPIITASAQSKGANDLRVLKALIEGGTAGATEPAVADGDAPAAPEPKAEGAAAPEAGQTAATEEAPAPNDVPAPEQPVVPASATLPQASDEPEADRVPLETEAPAPEAERKDTGTPGAEDESDEPEIANEPAIENDDAEVTSENAEAEDVAEGGADSEREDGTATSPE